MMDISLSKEQLEALEAAVEQMDVVALIDLIKRFGIDAYNPQGIRVARVRTGVMKESFRFDAIVDYSKSRDEREGGD
jgi:hypothetical protein